MNPYLLTYSLTYLPTHLCFESSTHVPPPPHFSVAPMGRRDRGSDRALRAGAAGRLPRVGHPRPARSALLRGRPPAPILLRGPRRLAAPVRRPSPPRCPPRGPPSPPFSRPGRAPSRPGSHVLPISSAASGLGWVTPRAALGAAFDSRRRAVRAAAARYMSPLASPPVPMTLPPPRRPRLPGRGRPCDSGRGEKSGPWMLADRDDDPR